MRYFYVIIYIFFPILISGCQQHAEEEMVLVRAGEFQIGDRRLRQGGVSENTFYLDAFYIDKYEVTVGDYKEFIEATGHKAPNWRRIAKESPTDRHPIVSVSWYDAMSYAQWAGKRLPTEMEWEKAARGGLVGKRYTWGDSIDPNLGNYNRNSGGTTVGGSYPANGYGIYDMAGNVWEWCLDEYVEDFGKNYRKRNPVSGGTIEEILANFKSIKTRRPMRGMAWSDSAMPVNISQRSARNPDESSRYYGFRCVKPVKR